MYLDLLAYSTSLAFFNYLILPASNVRELFNQNTVDVFFPRGHNSVESQYQFNPRVKINADSLNKKKKSFE